MTDTARPAPELLVIGASRGIGLATVKAALAAGRTVRAFARSADRIALSDPGLKTMPGDATDPADVAAALTGVRTVILILGADHNARAIFRPTRLFSQATATLLPAMSDAGVCRLIAVTGIGAGASRACLSFPERMLHDAVLGRIYADKTRQEEMILASGLDWTIVRPGILTNGAAVAAYQVLADPHTWRNGVISRASVADFLIRCAGDPSYFRRDVVLVN